MNVSRLFVTTATALSVLSAIGCTSTQTAPEVAAAPTVEATAPPPQVVEAPVPPPQVATTDEMPSHPALQNENTAAAPATNDAPPAVATPEPAMTPPADSFTERAPKTDHN